MEKILNKQKILSNLNSEDILEQFELMDIEGGLAVPIVTKLVVKAAVVVAKAVSKK